MGVGEDKFDIEVEPRGGAGRGVINKIRNAYKRILNYLSFAGRVSPFVVLLIVVLVGLTAGAFYVNYSPSANKICTLCHNMEPYYQGIATSPHREINCHKCHPLSPSVIREGVVQLLEAPSAAEIREKFGPEINMYEVCLKCHVKEDLLQRQIHNVHFEMAVEVVGACDICHNPHALEEIDSQCLKCHKETSTIIKHSRFHDEAVFRLEKGDTGVCLECHSKQAVWEVPLAPSCVRGQVEGKGCFDCHNAPLEPPDISGTPCTQCHK